MDKENPEAEKWTKQKTKGKKEMKLDKKTNKFVKLSIHGSLPSANTYLRMHWAKRRKMIESWGWAVKIALQKVKLNHIGNTSYFKVPMKITAKIFIKDKRKLKDTGNLRTPIDKLIVDNLVAQRILVDDSAEYLKWGEPEQRVGLPERVEITIEEIKND